MANPLDLLSGKTGLDAAEPVAGLDLLQPEPGPFRKGLDVGMAGVRSAFAGAGALAAHAVGAERLKQAALEKAAAESERAAQATQPLADVDWTSPESIRRQFAYYIGAGLPSMASMLLGAVVGRFAGGLGARALGPGAVRGGTYAGAAVPSIALEAGSTYPEALQTGIESPALRAAAGGTVGGLVELLPLLAAERYLKAAGKGGFGALAKGAAKGAPVGLGLEGTQEVIQEGISRFAAGQPLTGDEALNAYLESFAGGGAMGTLFGAGIGAARGRAPRVQPAPADTTGVQPPVVSAPPVTTEPAAPLPVPLTGAALDQRAGDIALLASLGEPPALGAPGAAVGAPTSLYDRLEAPIALEANRASLDALRAQEQGLLQRQEALSAELARPEGKRRAKSAISKENRELRTQIGDVRTQIGHLQAEIDAQIARQSTPATLGPRTRTTPWGVGIEPAGDTSSAELAVARQKREQGQLLTSREAELIRKAPAPATPALEVRTERAARESFKQVTLARQAEVIEGVAIDAINRQIEELTAAGGFRQGSVPAARKALETAAKKAAKAPTVEAAEKVIFDEAIKALSNRVNKADAEVFAKTLQTAVSEAPMFYSRGAVERKLKVNTDFSVLRVRPAYDTDGIEIGSVRKSDSQAGTGGSFGVRAGSVSYTFTPNDTGISRGFKTVREHKLADLIRKAVPILESRGAVDTSFMGRRIAQLGGTGDFISHYRGYQIERTTKQGIAGKREWADVFTPDGRFAGTFVADTVHNLTAKVQRFIEKHQAGKLESRAAAIEPAKLRIDNPGGEWLQNHRAANIREGRGQFGEPRRFGSVTASFDRNVLVPVSVLRTLPGLRGEQKNVRHADLARLVEHMKERGRLPAFSSDRDYAPFVEVNQDGEAWVNEGNHRIMAAEKLGWKYLPTEVRYFTGGENAVSIMSPSKIAEYEQQAAAEGRTLEGYKSRAAAFPTVNIGLNVGDVQNALTPQEALNALRATGVAVLQHSIHKSDTENTLVAHLSRALTPEEGHAVSVATRQEAIAQMVGNEGDLYGPGAEQWKPFNPSFFLTMEGERAAASLGALAPTSLSDLYASGLNYEDFLALPKAEQDKFIDGRYQVLSDAGQKLIDRIRDMVGKDVEVHLFTAKPGEAVGSYQAQSGRIKGLVNLATNAKDPPSVADHEGFHAVEDLILEDHEKKVITRALRDGSPLFERLLEKARAYDLANKTNLTDEITSIPQERRAYAFEFWKRGELQADTVLGRVFEKIKEFLTKIKNYIDGLGFQSIEDIFQAIDLGKYASRQKHEGTLTSFASEAARRAWYYSQLERMVTDKGSNAASKEMWKQFIANAPGVKKSEIEWSGINDWLDLQGARVTKDQVLQYIRANGVRVEETVLGDTGVWTPEMSQELDWLETNRDDLSEIQEARRQELITQENAISEPGGTPAITKFFSYQLPGGENYRELVLKLPQQVKERGKYIEYVTNAIRHPWRVFVEGETEHQASFATETEAKQFLSNFPTFKEPVGGPAFMSTHFEQPNVLAHVRFNERTDAEGKRVLFIEEIQSDWAQKGRSEGFAESNEQRAARLKGWTAEKNKAGFGWDVRDADGKLVSTEDAAAISAEAAISRAAGPQRAGIPPAPFVGKTEAWVALALKRMIAYAAENGFDRIAWTTGEQQVQRYEGALRKHVDRIEWEKTKEGVHLRGYKGESRNKKYSGDKVVETRYAENELSDAIGKTMADRIRNDPAQTGVIEGENIKIDDIGMATFYGRIVPNVANDILKKIGGGRVGETTIPIEGTRAEGRRVVAVIRDFLQEAPASKQPGFDITPAMAAAVNQGGLPLFSQAALDMDRQMKAGELEHAQEYLMGARIITRAYKKGPDNVAKTAFGALWSEIGGNLERWFKQNILTPNFVSRFSEGFKNVFTVLNTYDRYRAILIKTMLKEKMPAWYDASSADQAAAFKALLDRTVQGISRENLNPLMETLTPQQKTLFTSATKMIEGFLLAELESDKVTYRTLLTTPGEYEKWLANRTTQVNDLIDKGYVPLRRFGDHTVAVIKSVVGKDGRTQDLTVARLGFARSATAEAAGQSFRDELAREGLSNDYRVEVGYQYKAARDTTISVQQFIDTARRNGVPLTQQERERIVKALSASDSIMRNRLLRREGVAGYSEDGMRVLNEFGVTMAGKMSYAQFAPAIDAASDGFQVTTDISARNEPQISIDESINELTGRRNNLWEQEGPQSGFHHNLADELTDYVLVPDHTGGWSRKLRGAAMMYFLGGSISAGMVNTMSVPMLTVPELSIHTNYYNAMSTTLAAWKTSWQHQSILRDIVKLKDKDAFPIAEIDSVPGLRQALIQASEDGRTMDTEIHQIMGMAQGTMYSQSRSVQRAIETWMAPFRISEQTNRITSFIAGYKIGLENKLTGRDLYNFAGTIVDSTQNNYNEANRPGAARSPFFALAFMFKSFPLFMVEAAALMYKANPKNAVYMLLGLTMMTGVQGLPFAETIQDIIDTIAQNIFGSPFNSRRAMRNVVKQASEAIVGYDMSGLVLRGVINEVLGMSVSSRIGAGDFVPGTRLGTADADQGRVLESLLGAPYAMVKDVLTNAGKLVGGVATLDWKQSVDAVREGGPIAVRNAIKGVQQLQDGYATDSKGRKLIDISTPEALWQTIGIASAGLARAYELDRIDKQTNAFYQQVRSDLQTEMVRALKDGDSSRLQDLYDTARAWDERYPDTPLRLNPAAIRRQFVLSGMRLDERTLKMLPRALRGTSVAIEGSGVTP